MVGGGIAVTVVIAIVVVAIAMVLRLKKCNSHPAKSGHTSVENAPYDEVLDIQMNEEEEVYYSKIEIVGVDASDNLEIKHSTNECKETTVHCITMIGNDNTKHQTKGDEKHCDTHIDNEKVIDNIDYQLINDKTQHYNTVEGFVENSIYDSGEVILKTAHVNTDEEGFKDNDIYEYGDEQEDITSDSIKGKEEACSTIHVKNGSAEPISQCENYCHPTNDTEGFVDNIAYESVDDILIVSDHVEEDNDANMYNVVDDTS